MQDNKSQQTEASLALHTEQRSERPATRHELQPTEPQSDTQSALQPEQESEQPLSERTSEQVQQSSDDWPGSQKPVQVFQTFQARDASCIGLPLISERRTNALMWSPRIEVPQGWSCNATNCVQPSRSQFSGDRWSGLDFAMYAKKGSSRDDPPRGTIHHRGCVYAAERSCWEEDGKPYASGNFQK